MTTFTTTTPSMNVFVCLVALALVLAPRALAQPGSQRQVPPAAAALPVPADSMPPWVRQSDPTDAIIRRIWEEGTQRSQVASLAQALVDSIGPRLTGSPEIEAASAWAQSMYQRWGIPTRTHRYGTWPSWQRGYTHVDLIAPRTRTLEAMTLAWSPGTNGRAVTGDVVTLPDSSSADALAAWLRTVRGKFVLTSAPQLSCRSSDQWQEYGTPESRARIRAQQDSVNARWRARLSAIDSLQARLHAAGAAGIFSHGFSGYPGIDKIFGSPMSRVVTIDITCEDYGLLARMAERGQSPRVRVNATTESRGVRPVWNTIAEIRGRELPDEYVILSAHFDSWSAAGGATDNATGTIAMMEAMRILKTVLPQPKRTILVGHWNGEEQGLNGSRAFVEDHPEIVRGVQALFNQDNGTGRVSFMSPGALPGTATFLQRYLAEIPRETTQYIRFGRPGAPATGGSDHASFACMGAPAFSLSSLSWDYGLTTWHTNRDTYDKIVLDDLRNNAMLIAALAYQASEDAATMPRDRLDPLPPNPQTGEARAWPECRKAVRAVENYAR